MFVPINTPYTLNCTSRGSPPDTFTWRKDDGPVSQSTNITAVDHTDTSALFCAYYTIDRVTPDDSGIYTCNITNPIGSDSADIAIITASTYVLCM